MIPLGLPAVPALLGIWLRLFRFGFKPPGCFNCTELTSDEHENFPQECKPVTEVYAAPLYVLASRFLSRATAGRLKTAGVSFPFQKLLLSLLQFSEIDAVCWRNKAEMVK